MMDDGCYALCNECVCVVRGGWWRWRWLNHIACESALALHEQVAGMIFRKEPFFKGHDNYDQLVKSE